MLGKLHLIGSIALVIATGLGGCLGSQEAVDPAGLRAEPDCHSWTARTNLPGAWEAAANNPQFSLAPPPAGLPLLEKTGSNFGMANLTSIQWYPQGGADERIHQSWNPDDGATVSPVVFTVRQMNGAWAAATLVGSAVEESTVHEWAAGFLSHIMHDGQVVQATLERFMASRDDTGERTSQPRVTPEPEGVMAGRLAQSYETPVNLRDLRLPPALLQTDPVADGMGALTVRLRQDNWTATVWRESLRVREAGPAEDSFAEVFRDDGLHLIHNQANRSSNEALDAAMNFTDRVGLPRGDWNWSEGPRPKWYCF